MFTIDILRSYSILVFLNFDLYQVNLIAILVAIRLHSVVRFGPSNLRFLEHNHVVHYRFNWGDPTSQSTCSLILHLYTYDKQELWESAGAFFRATTRFSPQVA